MFDNAKKIQTAVEAVLYIALNAVNGPVHSRDLTRFQAIAPRYLEPVLQRLGRAGIIDGIRGPRGGYQLGRERRRITVGEIVRVIDGVERDGAADAVAGPIARQVVAPLWRECEEAFLARLDSVTIEDLCRQATEAGLAPEPTQPLDFTI